MSLVKSRGSDEDQRTKEAMTIAARNPGDGEAFAPARGSEDGFAYSSEELLHLKEEMDSWIKSLRVEIRAVSDQSDDLEDEVMKQGEESHFNYENISSLHERLDRIEEMVEDLRVALSTTLPRKKLTSGLQPLRPKL